MREYNGIWAKVITIIGIAASGYALVVFSGFFTFLGVPLLPLLHRSFYFGLILALTFLVYPATKTAPKNKLPWYDLMLALLSLLPLWYITFFIDRVTDHQSMGVGTTYEIILGYLLMILTLEAARRTVGLVFPLIASFFILHPLLSNYFPGILHGRGYSLERIVGHMYLLGEGMLGLPLGIAATIIVGFIIFSQFLQITGAGEFFANLAFSLFGHVRGGAAKVSIVASSFFGTLSGSNVANVATTGTFTIPIMKKAGYSSEFAAAVEAVSSNGGILMPPVMGAVAFIMAEMLGMSYGKVIIYAFLPALLYYIAVFMQVDLRAARLGIKGLPRSELPSFRKTLKEGWIFLLPLVVLIIFLVVLLYRPEKSVWWALVCLVIVSSIRKESRLNLSKIASALESASKAMCMVGVACAVAGIMIGSMNLTGVSVKLSSSILAVSGGNVMILLLLAAAASFVLGMGLTSIPCYLMVGILICPALVSSGTLPIAAHLFAFYFALTSFITPPVCLLAYAAASIAQSNPMATGFQAMRLGIITFIIPFMFVYSPNLLLIGGPGEVILAFITSVVGVLLLACGLEGYALIKANWRQRILFVAGGLALIVPGWASDILGVGLGTMLLLWQRRRREAHRYLGTKEESNQLLKENSGMGTD